MNGQDAFLFLGAFLVMVAAGYMVIERWLGPDPDLDGPWQPGDKPRWNGR